MTAQTSSTPHGDASKRRARHVDVFIALVVAVSILATLLTVWIELRNGIASGINWPLYATFAVLLFASETASESWMKMTNGGLVTMSWTFAFSLVLLGSPAGAVLALALATLLGELRTRSDLRRTVFNTAQVSMALAFGSLTLYAFGISEPLAGRGSIPLLSGLAILCSGLVVFVTNGLSVCYIISVSRGDRLARTIRNGFAVSLTADGALLALAPIFVVSIQFSLMMVPLLAIATAIVYQSAVQALERAHDANHDTLTELRNRRAFVAEVDEYLVDRLADDTATVLLIDLDGFKAINDRLGHQVGDSVLREFASRLSASLPDGSIAARLGGDEFAALVPEGRLPGRSIDFDALHQALVQPMTIDGVRLSVGASVGVSSCPRHGDSSAELLNAADIAMYRAKQFQTGVEHHDASAPSQLGRHSLLRALSEAVGTDQLSMRYQPLVHMRDGHLVAVQATVHWVHPDHGQLPIEEVIGLSEQTDLIGRVTDFAIERSVRDVVALDDDRLILSIAVSTSALHDPTFAKRTLSTLHRLQLRSDRLELGIAAGSLVSDPERSRASIIELRAAGVRITVDDFGTGSSSYLMLRDLKIDRLKIDRVFVRGMEHTSADRVIVQSVVDLAHGFGVVAVADGVDTDTIWGELVAMGCDVAQGAAVAPAMRLAELVSWRESDADSTSQAVLR